MKKIQAAAFFAATILTAEAILPFSSAAIAVDEAKQLMDALTTRSAMHKTYDYNADGTVNSVDLTLLKRKLLAAADSGEQSEQTITAITENTKLIGRTLTKDGVTWLVQSGSAVECTVTGTEASVTIAGDGCVYSEEQWRPRYGVYVDGELIADVVMDEPEQTVKLFSGTSQRTATVKVMHLSEANNGAIGVKQFDVTSSAAKPIKPTAKKDLTIEFIGDSITCAYGVEAESQYVSFATGTENFARSYAYLTAELLNADYSAVCYSGHGIISGYSNDGAAETGSLVPDVYANVGKLTEYAVPWDFESNPSDVVVLNLGTNDDTYVTKDLAVRGLEYQEGYVNFLKMIRKYNPDAAIVCTLGIMGCAELYPYIEAAIAEVGDPKISCYESPIQNFADGVGADWHPSAATHELNSYLLADKICTAIGRESSKIGIDMAFEGEYGVDIDESAGANAWPYFNDYDKSLNINVMSSGSTPESITAYVRNLNLPAGGYELAFSANPPAGAEIEYAVRSMSDPTKVYCSGTMSNEKELKAFTMDAADSSCEIVFFVGTIGNSNITFRDITLYKRS